MEKNNFRIGVVGGMGPMAGVLLQKLIIEATPAMKDQDHLEVVCYTNPHVPDRTRSLREDDGVSFSDVIIDSIRVLERTDVDCVIIPCNTAHTRFQRIQNAVEVPLLNMISIVLNALEKEGVKAAGLLGTDGTIASGIFSSNPNMRVIVPEADMQREVMAIIYDIKAAKHSDALIAPRIHAAIKNLREQGAQKIIMGCTELSLYGPFPRNIVIDPLVEVASAVVEIALQGNRA